MPRKGRVNSHHSRPFLEPPVQSNMLSNDFFGATAAAPFEGPEPEAAFENFMAEIKAYNLRDAKQKNAECLKANNLVAALKKRLKEMEIALEEEQSEYLKLQAVHSRWEASELQARAVALKNFKLEKAKTTKLEEDLAALADSHGKNLQENRTLDTQLRAVQREKSQQLTKLKGEYDAVTVDLEARLRKETQLRHAAERCKRNIETELNDLKEHVNAQLQLVDLERQKQAAHEREIQREMAERMNLQLRAQETMFEEKRAQVEELQQQLATREGEFSHAISKCDAEAAEKAQTLKVLREVENQLVAVQADLDTEKAGRAIAEKQNRDLNAEMEALKTALLDTAATQKELRTSNEMELALFKKTLQDVSTAHEIQIADLRRTHSQAMAELNEQLDALKKTKATLEKVQTVLEARIAAEKQVNQALGTETQKLHLHVQNLEDQLAEKAILLRQKGDEQQRLEGLFEKQRLEIQGHTDGPASVPNVIEERTPINSENADEYCDAAPGTSSNLRGFDAESAAARDDSQPESGHHSDSDYVIGVRKPRVKAKTGAVLTDSGSGPTETEEATGRAEVFGENGDDQEFVSSAEEDVAATKRTKRLRYPYNVISDSADRGKAKSTDGGTLNDEQTPLLQLMDKHGKSPTAKSNIRKAPAAAGRPMISSSLVVQNCTGASVNSAVLQEEMHSCGDRDSHRSEKRLLWLMWLFYAVVNFKVLQRAMQFCGNGNSRWLQKRDTVDVTPVEVNRKPHRVFPSACKFSTEKPFCYLSSRKTRANGFIFLFLLLMLQSESVYFPLTPVIQTHAGESSEILKSTILLERWVTFDLSLVQITRKHRKFFLPYLEPPEPPEQKFATTRDGFVKLNKFVFSPIEKTSRSVTNANPATAKATAGPLTGILRALLDTVRKKQTANIACEMAKRLEIVHTCVIAIVRILWPYLLWENELRFPCKM